MCYIDAFIFNKHTQFHNLVVIYFPNPFWVTSSCLVGMQTILEKINWITYSYILVPWTVAYVSQTNDWVKDMCSLTFTIHCQIRF